MYSLERMLKVQSAGLENKRKGLAGLSNKILRLRMTRAIVECIAQHDDDARGVPDRRQLSRRNVVAGPAGVAVRRQGPARMRECVAALPVSTSPVGLVSALAVDDLAAVPGSGVEEVGPGAGTEDLTWSCIEGTSWVCELRHERSFGSQAGT